MLHPHRLSVYKDKRRAILPTEDRLRQQVVFGWPQKNSAGAKINSGAAASVFSRSSPKNLSHSHVDTVQEARENLREALELFFETASPMEIQRRFHDEIYITRLEIAVG